MTTILNVVLFMVVIALLALYAYSFIDKNEALKMIDNLQEQLKRLEQSLLENDAVLQESEQQYLRLASKHEQILKENVDLLENNRKLSLEIANITKDKEKPCLESKTKEKQCKASSNPIKKNEGKKQFKKQKTTEIKEKTTEIKEKNKMN